jgi:hypothetical protein
MNLWGDLQQNVVWPEDIFVLTTPTFRRKWVFQGLKGH